MNLNPFELRPNDYCVKDLFTETRFGWFKPTKFGAERGGYEYLLRGINIDVNWTIICYAGNYQGELYCLGESKGLFYYVNTGYGSCSGCDWYQAKEDKLDGLQEVQDGLKLKIREFNSLNDFLEWFKGEYTDSWCEEESNEFLSKIADYYKI